MDFKMLNETELSSIQYEFQERVSDLQLDKATCIRFLVAREYDLDKSENMIRSNEKWKRDEDIENILHLELPEFIKEDFPFRFMGRSRNGGPVIWIPMGLWKTRFWIERGEKEAITKFSYYLLESALKQMKAMDDKPVVAIMGMEGLTYHKISHFETLRCTYNGFQVLERNYPEILQNVVILNAHWTFNIGFNFTKPIFSLRSLNKLQIFGSDKKQWLPVLRSLCFEDTIPEDYL